MTVLDSEHECIRFARLAIQEYYSLTELITEPDFANWNKILLEQSDFEDFLIGRNAKLNLLNTMVIVGLGIDKAISNPIQDHCQSLLLKLNTYLEALPTLKKDKKFRDKIKNLEGYNFLSTLSELSMANWFSNLGFRIEFETKFRQSTSGKNRDVDLTITDKLGNIVHFEVYMPNGYFTSK